MQWGLLICWQSYQLENETLQSAALQLSCHARNLTNELKLLVSLSMSPGDHSTDYSVQRQHYVSVLFGVSRTVSSIKIIAAKIDRYWLLWNSLVCWLINKVIEMNIYFCCSWKAGLHQHIPMYTMQYNTNVTLNVR